MMNELKKLARDLKISDFGIVKARVFSDLCLDFNEIKNSTFSHASIDEQTNPFLIMPDVESIIVCLFSYNNDKIGNISKYAMGKDYHKVIIDKLTSLSTPLIEKGYKCEIFSDSWKMNERLLAREAGLGFIGKNHLLINQEYGSFVFIGAILTDCILPYSTPTTDTCANCNKCINSCAGGALAEDGSFLQSNCLSYITQKKGALNHFEADLIRKNKTIWGCDICQDVCPYNKSAKLSEIEEFKEDLIVDLKIPYNISNREFKRMYKNRAFSWRGASPLIRNQQILEE